MWYLDTNEDDEALMMEMRPMTLYLGNDLQKDIIFTANHMLDGY